MLKNEATIPLTKAEQLRDFLHINDLISLYDIILKKYEELGIYESFDVGSGINTELKYILEFIKNKTKSKSKLEYGALPYRNNELMVSSNDLSYIKKLGWKPIINIDKGLLSVIKFENKNL